MSRILFIFASAVWLAACSQSSTPPADSTQAQPPAAAAQPAPDAAAQPVNPPAPADGAAALAPAAPPLERSSSAPATPAPSASATPSRPAPSARPTTPPAPAAAEPPPAATAVPAPSTAERTPPREPEFRAIRIPSGTALSVSLSTAVASDTSQVEDEVRGTLTRPLVIDGVTAVPAGAEVIGTVRDAKRSGRVKGLASVTFRFERIVAHGESLTIRTASITRQAEVKRKEDVKKGAIGAGAGAIIGGILGGGKGAAIGAGVGGTGAVVATRGEEARLPAGTTVRTTLQQPLEVTVPRPAGS